jgi:hypothetical protein
MEWSFFGEPIFAPCFAFGEEQSRPYQVAPASGYKPSPACGRRLERITA